MPPLIQFSEQIIIIISFTNIIFSTNLTIVLALKNLISEVVVLHGTREGSEILDTISGRPESDDVKV